MVNSAFKSSNQGLYCVVTFWRYKSAYQCCHMPVKHAFLFANVNMLIFIAAELLERMKCVNGVAVGWKHIRYRI